MLEIYAYNAGKGDCIRIRYDELRNIFIDTGVTRFGAEFKRICDEIKASEEKLEVLILTHVDDDHIGGILANLRSRSYTCPFNEVWMNHLGTASVGDRELSARQNDEVYARLTQMGVTVKPFIAGDQKSVAGAVLRCFWPEKAEMEKRTTKDVLLARHCDYGFTLSELAEMPIASQDISINNRNSIIFVFEYDGHRLLFTGDAWAEHVVKAAGTYDLIKLPHHGSIRNVSEAYTKALNAANFLICTDGIGHPDKQTIAKLEKWYGEINIYSPSAWWSNNYIRHGDLEHRISYKKTEGLVMVW